MGLIISDAGLSGDNWCNGFVPLMALSPHMAADIGPVGIDLPSGPVPRTLRDRLVCALRRITLLRIRLSNFADVGALARAYWIREAGYRGRMRAHGAVLAGHYRLMRDVGFDEVELTAGQIGRQPPEHWLAERQVIDSLFVLSVLGPLKQRTGIT